MCQFSSLLTEHFDSDKEEVVRAQHNNHKRSPVHVNFWKMRAEKNNGASLIFWYSEDVSIKTGAILTQIPTCIAIKTNSQKLKQQVKNNKCT